MKNTFDFNGIPQYLDRQMFLDGSVTVQRFDEFRYPKIDQYEKTARGFFWVPEEIDLTKDKADFKEATDAIAHCFTSNLLRQTALDSLQGRTPTQIFLPVVSIPELETLMMNWGFFESNIHSRSYSHIIRNIYNVPKTVFNSIHDTQQIIDMASNVGKYYNELHRLNCLKEIHPEMVSEEDHIDAIWLALHTSYALEALRFMPSFITSLAMAELKLFIGNGNIISLILQDEVGHRDWTAYIINRVVKDDPRFAAAKIRCMSRVMQIYKDCVAEEKAWIRFLMSKGSIIGLGVQILDDAMDYIAGNALKEIGIQYWMSYPKSTPVPWFTKHIEISKKQTALQENESTNYIIGVMSETIDYDSLPDL